MANSVQQGVLVLQHVPWEGPGLIGAALDRVGVPFSVRNIVAEADPRLPGMDELAGLVIMGGPMDADDVLGYPGLAREVALIRDAVAANVPVLGICLGHQLLAMALGAQLRTGVTREVGMAPVEVVAGDPVLGGLGTTPVVHWHTDNVGLPSGATLLARTAQCPNQAFRYGSAIGIQFHLELDEVLLRAWLDDGQMADQLVDTTGAQLLADFNIDAAARTAGAEQAFGPFVHDAAEQAARAPIRVRFRVGTSPQPNVR
ncbi:type 1 glutamine amidotransferase [Paenarthrobacter sp. Z7-10]|uniref:type 1 glutamine amidotransferase n=1 Tax=Paenarthrobacter sp. Z7-10 TaxID=2787635 RepID=UPI0022A936A2|nr:type 1 glutamine amidotransferase [Paenarthrobacter sp. Z7-10]MCZ2402760.1 type 1 glutamine amidotransferase [Paenarthrobacter sp. Z7-10]